VIPMGPDRSSAEAGRLDAKELAAGR
jgi:hypothetical protein